MCIYLFISDKIMNMWKAQCHKPTIWECLIKYVFMILGMFYYWFDLTLSTKSTKPLRNGGMKNNKKHTDSANNTANLGYPIRPLVRSSFQMTCDFSPK